MARHPLCVTTWRAAVAAAVIAVATAAARAEEAPAGKPNSPADYDRLITESDRGHWAFRPVTRPAIPAVKDAGWVRTPIDAFVLAKLEERAWTPAPEALPHQLLRRVYLDLIGLPPTPEELAAFRADESPDAFERVVENLLTRPAHGERWGRHWLDLVRYAETNGYERDGAKPHVWRYRDYVIRSFAADKPFDRFILEQLAGDELPDASSETVIALGYNRLGPWDDEPADPLEDRFDQLDDIVSTTSQVFLGLTLGCARCHNHKFDPLTTLDYYRMVAVFNPLKRFQQDRADLDAPAGNAAELAALAERDREIAALQAEVRKAREAAREELLASGRSQLPGEALAAFRTKPPERTPEQQKLAAQFQKQLEEEVSASLGDEARQQAERNEARIAELRSRVPDLPRAYYMHEPGPAPPATHVLLRGKAARPGIEAPPGVPAVLVPEQPEFVAPGERTSRRRLSLARWIASPDNPLTARVIVNRVWQFHFGEGLVRTPSDFGVMGRAPSHPELLDWLADWFVSEGWSIRKLHRLILGSSTYRMSKAWRPECGEADPENRLLWRFPYRRLEAEAIRDSMLAVSGRLNRQMFGPGMHPYIPREALAGSSDPDKIWPAFDPLQASRRTVYAFIKRSLVVPMIEVLDLCDTARSSAQRAVTSVAPQALTLFNGHFVNEQAAHLAARLEREAPGDAAAQVRRAWLLSFCREPSQAELENALAFLSEESAGQAPLESRLQPAEAGTPTGPGAPAVGPGHQALVQLCRVILNLNEFVYPD